MTDKKYQGATIVRAPNEDNYFKMKRQTAQDKNLSFEARGMIAYILSKKDGWTMQVHDLQQNCAKGRVYRILDELSKSGYLEKRSKKQVKGRWEWSPYILHEVPYPQKQDTEKQDTENAEITEQITDIKITDNKPPVVVSEAKSQEQKDKERDAKKTDGLTDKEFATIQKIIEQAIMLTPYMLNKLKEHAKLYTPDEWQKAIYVVKEKYRKQEKINKPYEFLVGILKNKATSLAEEQAVISPDRPELTPFEAPSQSQEWSDDDISDIFGKGKEE